MTPMMLGQTHSSWINAWTLRRACAPLGVDLRVPAGRRELPLPMLAPGDPPQWQFFTEEASLREGLQGRLSGRFWPAQFPQDLLDDKWAFAQWLAEEPAGPTGLPQWPIDFARQAMPPWQWPVLLKARHSWRGEVKLPRGWVCRDAAALQAALAALPAQGLRPEWFFLQAWLGEAPLQLLSVGGFFDADDESRNLACVTERLVGYGEGLSSSAALATVADEHGLVAQAEAVLRRLRFRGPYEMEFIAQAGAPCRVLELNPRFWMQHGIYLAAGNGLVKRYLGLDTAADRAAPPPSSVLWVDGVWLWRRLLRLDFAALRLLWSGGRRRVVCPSLPAVLAASLWRLVGGAR